MKKTRIMTYIFLIMVSFFIISINGVYAFFTYDSYKDEISDNKNNLKPEFDMKYEGDDIDENGKILLDIEFLDKAFPYKKGTSYSIFISNDLPSDIIVTYSGNDKTEIGTYIVTATFKASNDKYLLPESVSAKLTIYDQDQYEYEVIDNSYIKINKYNGNNLTSLVVPSSFYIENNNDIISYPVKVIGDNAFLGHIELNSIIIPSGVEKMSFGILAGCNNLNEISIPFIGETQDTNTNLCYLFGGYNYRDPKEVPKTLTDLELTNSEYIKEGSIYGIGITSITLSSSIKSIHNNAFEESNIKHIYFNGKIEDWCNIDFETANANPMCSGNAVFHLAKNKYEYYGYKEITELIIPSSVTKLKNTFVNFTSLKSVTIPNSVKSISGNTFLGCSSIESISIPFVGESETENTYFGYIFGQPSYGVASDYISTNLKEVIINGGTKIGDSSFKNCTSIKSITLSETITSLGSSVFEGCSSLTSIYIPSTVTDIGFGIFKGCSNLETITVPFIGPKIDSTDKAYLGYFYQGYSEWNHGESVESALKNIIILNDNDILDRAFYECIYIESIILPNSIKKIGYNSFEGCLNLNSIYYNGKKDEWNLIIIDSSNNDILNNLTIYYYSPINLGYKNYWYYDDNKNIKIWNSNEN